MPRKKSNKRHREGATEAALTDGMAARTALGALSVSLSLIDPTVDAQATAAFDAAISTAMASQQTVRADRHFPLPQSFHHTNL